jgi:outer membrane lipoprotein carrier protein
MNQYHPFKYTLWLFIMIAIHSQAAGLDRMNAYFQNTQSAQADIQQTVFDKQGHKTQEVTGHMKIQKPSKFRWDYNKPYVQVIVGDGENVWLYDPELNQVTVRPFSKALGSSPAALLAGGKEMERAFEIKDVSRKGDLEWVVAVPKVNETGFERVFLGFKEDALMEMELHDSFGNRTIIKFSQLERNMKIPASAFKFAPPSGADVLRE